VNSFGRVVRSSVQAALVAGALLASPSAAQDVFISTSVQCKQWAAARAKRNAVNYEHYLQGFLDGYSLGNKVDFWGTTESARLTPAQAFARMDDYCQAHPLGSLLEGAHRLFLDRQKELAAAQKKPEEKKKR
jgi:hypothetical protein